MSDEKKFSIENAFEELDAAIKEMESDEITLERSFELYKDGMELIKKCEEEIECVEKKVLALSSNGELHEFQ